MSILRITIILLVASHVGCIKRSSTIITDSTGARYQLVPGGIFVMGSPRADGSAGASGQFSKADSPLNEFEPPLLDVEASLKVIRENRINQAANGRGRDESEGVPLHNARIRKDFYIGLTEVTQGQWERVMGTTPWLDDDGKPRWRVKVGANYPAVYVSWEDAVAFCKRLSAKEGATYRLPTEAEWEYACRAGTRTVFSYGDGVSKLGDYAWYERNSFLVGEEHARKVGQKLPNSWGLYDMHGNVNEWCGDWYSWDYFAPEHLPPRPNSSSAPRVYRGGSWNGTPWNCRSAYRNWESPSHRSNDLGFRVLRSSVQP